MYPKEQDENQYEDEANWFYIFCVEAKEEDMIQCIHCKTWVHTRCAKSIDVLIYYFTSKILCKDCKKRVDELQ